MHKGGTVRDPFWRGLSQAAQWYNILQVEVEKWVNGIIQQCCLIVSPLLNRLQCLPLPHSFQLCSSTVYPKVHVLRFLFTGVQPALVALCLRDHWMKAVIFMLQQMGISITSIGALQVIAHHSTNPLTLFQKHR